MIYLPYFGLDLFAQSQSHRTEQLRKLGNVLSYPDNFNHNGVFIRRGRQAKQRRSVEPHGRATPLPGQCVPQAIRACTGLCALRVQGRGNMSKLIRWDQKIDARP